VPAQQQVAVHVEGDSRLDADAKAGAFEHELLRPEQPQAGIVVHAQLLREIEIRGASAAVAQLDAGVAVPAAADPHAGRWRTLRLGQLDQQARRLGGVLRLGLRDQQSLGLDRARADVAGVKKWIGEFSIGTTNWPSE
jgi:hypothetical protein